MSNEAKEIYDYIKSVTKDDTTKAEFSSHLAKYSLEHILEAHQMLQEDKLKEE